MNMAVELFFSKLIYALGWTIAHSVWQAALIATMLLTFLTLKKRETAESRYWVSFIGFLMIIASSIYTFSSYWTLYKVVVRQLESGQLLTLRTESGSYLAQVFNQYIHFVVALWFIGLVTGLIRYTGAILFCKSLVKTSVDDMSPSLIMCIQEVAKRLNISRCIPLRSSTKVLVPCVVGVFKPVVLMPVAIANQLNIQQLEAIIAHELAHIKRNDYLIGMLQSLIKVVYFFNPFMLYVSSFIDRERENICDDLAVTVCGDKVLYSRSLEAIARLSESSNLAMAINGRHDSVYKRIRRQFEQGAPKQHRSGYWFSLTGIAFSALLVATNAVGGDLYRTKYEGIDSLSDKQIAELLLLSRNSVGSALDPARSFRSNVLDENKLFGQMPALEKEKFMEYLYEELWKYHNLDNWNLELMDETPKEIRKELLTLMFASNMKEQFRHLEFQKPDKIVKLNTEDGHIQLTAKMFSGMEYISIDFDKSFLKSLILNSKKTIQKPGFVAAFTDRGITFILSEKNKTASMKSKSLNSLAGYHFYSENTDEVKRNNGLSLSNMAISYKKKQLVVILSPKLIERLLQGQLSSVGNPVIGATPRNDGGLSIYIDNMNRQKISDRVVDIYIQYGRNENKQDLSAKHIDSESEKKRLEEHADLLFTEKELSDYITGYLIVNENTPEYVQKAIRKSLQKNIIDKIQSGQKLVDARPMSFEDIEAGVFYAFRQYLPTNKPELDFTIDVRSEPITSVIEELATHCPSLSKKFEILQPKNVSVHYENLNCARAKFVVCRIVSNMSMEMRNKNVCRSSPTVVVNRTSP